MKNNTSAANETEHLGELTYNLNGSHHALPVDGSSADYSSAVATVREIIAGLEDEGATHVRWSKNDNASQVVEAESLGVAGR
jgi:hypothetical protein